MWTSPRDWERQRARAMYLVWKGLSRNWISTDVEKQNKKKTVKQEGAPALRK